MTSLEDLREWPQPTVMKLFELVKPHPILYDCTHEHWTNTIEKGRIWTRIAKQLDPYLTSKKCRDRFQSNKKKYATEIRKQIARGDDENVNLDLVWLLDQHDEEKENCSNLMETLKAGSPIDDHDVENGMHPHESDQEAAASANDHITTSGSTMIDLSDGERPSKRKRKDSTPEKFEQACEQPEFKPIIPFNNNSFIEFLASIQDAQQQQQQKQVEEECNVFGRQVEIDLRRLNSINRTKARLAITSILSDLYQQQQS